MLEKLRQLLHLTSHDQRVQNRLDILRQHTPIPVIWFFGKTQSGKTSLIKSLTGAEETEIGQGFKPCTRFSRRYPFPTAEAPLLTFLDTRGMDEPGYDPEEDLKQFNDQAHVVIVTIRVLDHAQQSMLEHLRTIRRAQPARPVLLVHTCLHEAYPQRQHIEPYPFVERNLFCSGTEEDGMNSVLQNANEIPAELLRSLEEQYRRFEGLVDKAVPVDLTRPEDGFTNPNYGAEELKKALLELLPHAYRQTFLTLEEAKQKLSDLYARQALPRIAGYSTLAATAGALPVPWLDLLILPAIQSRMIFHLARFYGQPLTATRFLELAGSLGLGMLVRQAAREVAKLIPFAGSVAGGVLAGASTFALGKAFCFYYSAVHHGHVPKAEDLRRYYQEQLALAEQAWASFARKE
jgi:uncharacterized protein (DUF697 family)